MKYCIFLFLIIMSCSSKDKDPAPKPEIDPILQPFVDQFYLDAEAHGWNDLPKNNVTMRFNLKPGEAGILLSASHKEGNLWICELSHSYLDDWGSYKSSVYREMAHVLIDKDYNQNMDAAHEDIMCIMFCACEDDGSIWASLLDKLFEK
jgi:hypothetical protein